jgi:hypothetical protein
MVRAITVGFGGALGALVRGRRFDRHPVRHGLPELRAIQVGVAGQARRRCAPAKQRDEEERRLRTSQGPLRRLTDRTLRRIPVVGRVYNVADRFVGLLDQQQGGADIGAMSPV